MGSGTIAQTVDTAQSSSALLALAICFGGYLLWSLWSGYIFMNGKRGRIYRVQETGIYWKGISLLTFLFLIFLAVALWRANWMPL
jgi:hypothetical protein